MISSHAREEKGNFPELQLTNDGVKVKQTRLRKIIFVNKILISLEEELTNVILPSKSGNLF